MRKHQQVKLTPEQIRARFEQSLQKNNDPFKDRYEREDNTYDHRSQVKKL